MRLRLWECKLREFYAHILATHASQRQEEDGVEVIRIRRLELSAMLTQHCDIPRLRGQVAGCYISGIMRFAERDGEMWRFKVSEVKNFVDGVELKEYEPYELRWLKRRLQFKLFELDLMLINSARYKQWPKLRRLRFITEYELYQVEDMLRMTRR